MILEMATLEEPAEGSWYMGPRLACPKNHILTALQQPTEVCQGFFSAGREAFNRFPEVGFHCGVCLEPISHQAAAPLNSKKALQCSLCRFHVCQRCAAEDWKRCQGALGMVWPSRARQRHFADAIACPEPRRLEEICRLGMREKLARALLEAKKEDSPADGKKAAAQKRLPRQSMPVQNPRASFALPARPVMKEALEMVEDALVRFAAESLMDAPLLESVRGPEGVLAKLPTRDIALPCLFGCGAKSPDLDSWESHMENCEDRNCFAEIEGYEQVVPERFREAHAEAYVRMHNWIEVGGTLKKRYPES